MEDSSDKPGGLDALTISAARNEYFESRGTTLNPRIRPSIARSWKRSLGCRIAHEIPRLAVAALPRVDSTLLEVVESVVEEFAAQVSDLEGIVTFADSHGTLAQVRTDAPAANDRAELLPIGAQVLEEIIGTNSDGIAIEERQPAQVWNGEHVMDLFQGNCCTSVPVLDPVNRALVGVLTLTVTESVAQRVGAPALLLMVSAYAWNIQMRTEQATVSSERQLLHDFLRENRKRGNEYVIGSDGKVVIASASYLAMASKYDLDVALSVLRTHRHRESPPERVASSDGTGYTVNLPSGVAATGAVAILKPEGDKPDAGVAAESFPVLRDLVGMNDEFLKAVRSGSISVRKFEPLIFAGEFGVGKSTMAESIAKDLELDLHKFDCTNELDEIRRVLSRKPPRRVQRAVFAQHVEQLEEAELARLVSTVRQTPRVSLICSAENRLDSLLLFATRHDVNFIHVPSLRRRRDDIPLLIDHFLEGTGCGISTSLKGTFVAANWPGNIQQLRKVISYAIENNHGGELTIRDLDSTDRKLLTHGRLTRLEEAELDQIRSAIFEACGNKSLAASLLEIGRSTLYRRVDYFVRRGFDVGGETAS